MKPLSSPEKWILAGIPVLFVAGAILHFVYQISGESPIVALFAPVNESIWEHTKLVLWPMMLWWVLYDLFCGKQNEINRNKWYEGALFALITSLFSIPLLYYFYTGAFGVECFWVDILILLAALLFGQLLGLHVYRNGRGICVTLVLGIFVALALLYGLFTFYPPHIPLFEDSLTGSYGINP